MSRRSQRHAVSLPGGIPPWVAAGARQQFASVAGLLSAAYFNTGNLVAGSVAFVGVIVPTASRQILVSGSLPYVLASATSAQWQWNFYTQNFLVNGAAPAYGFTKGPNVSGGEQSIIAETPAYTAAQNNVVFTPFVVNAIPFGSLPGAPVGFGLTLLAAGGGGNVTAGISALQSGSVFLQELP